jgi:hypothetical protein
LYFLFRLLQKFHCPLVISPAASQSTNLLGLILTTFIGARWSYRSRIVPGFIAFVALLAASCVIGRVVL